MNRARRWTFRGLAALLGFVAALAALEGLGAVVYHYEKELDESISHPSHLQGQAAFHQAGFPREADPYLLYRVGKDYRHSKVQTNQYGLRNGEISANPGPNTVRILLLGGSVAWGYHSLSNDDTISAYLEGILNQEYSDRTGLRFEVLNGAAPGYVAWQESLIYALYLRELGSQVVIALDGANEVAAGLTASAAGYPLGYDAATVSQRHPRLSLIKVISEWAEWRFRRFKTYRLIHDSEIPRLGITKWIRRVRRRTVQEIQPPSPDQVAEAYSLSMQHLADVTAFDKRFLLAVLQPLLILPESKIRTAFEETIAGEFEIKSPGATHYYFEVFDRLRAGLKGLEERNSHLRSVDSSLLFQADAGDVFVDYCHLTSRGRQSLARMLADAVTRLPLETLLEEHPR